MQYFSDRLYVVTTSGYLTCIDVSESAIAAAQAGNLPDAVHFKAPTTQGVAPSNTLETTGDRDLGVVVKCIREGQHLGIRVASDLYSRRN